MQTDAIQLLRSPGFEMPDDPRHTSFMSTQNHVDVLRKNGTSENRVPAFIRGRPKTVADRLSLPACKMDFWERKRQLCSPTLFAIVLNIGHR